MRNLKRALSLALAAIMLVGMMVVSASAASYNNLTDKDEIVNKDAVSMLVSLGIIEGKPDGSYAPTENVDRAQMAKMISVIMNQGVDNGALYENSPSGLTDISSHWAKGHINYCYTTGIIAGRGNGKFDPAATVTGNEAAKMLLVAAGYDAQLEGLTGHPVLDTLQAVEPLGPRRLADALVIAPCTGATLARLAEGLSDTPVTLAAKSLLRVGSPIVVAISTNDGLGASGENIARLYQRKHYYFVPYGQDDPNTKPQSLKARFELLPQTLEAALEGRQLQPVLQCPCG